MQSTYVASYEAHDGSTAYKIVRVFGKAPVDTIRQTLEKHGILPREIIRGADKATLEEIMPTSGHGNYQVMYIQGKCPGPEWARAKSKSSK